MRLNIKNIVLLIGIGTSLLVSCKKEFLDFPPVSNASTTVFYKTAGDLETALFAAYSALQLGAQYNSFYFFGEIRSDNTTITLRFGGFGDDEIDRFYTTSTNNRIDNFYRDSYTGINRCNIVIDRIGAVQMDQKLKDQYVAEAKFLRALMYFNLVRVFGDVPLVLKEISSVAQATTEGYTLGRTPVNQVYEQMIADLTAADASLPITYTSNGIGRATKGAAKALLGKVYLTQRNFSLAAAPLKEVIDMNIYKLLPNYADLWLTRNENSSESVFEVQYRGNGTGEGSPFANSFAPRASQQSVVNLGTAGGTAVPMPDLIEAYQPGDLRKSASIAPGYTNSAGAFVAEPFTNKFRGPVFAQGDGDNNWPVIRYADVLLMYAEALNEINGSSPEALMYFNKVRRRAYGENIDAATPQAHDVMTTDQQAFRLLIEQERRVELAFEGHRWFDLVRTGRAQAVMDAHAKRNNLGFTVEPFELIFPIPQSQIDINPTVMKQNEGYAK